MTTYIIILYVTYSLVLTICRWSSS